MESKVNKSDFSLIRIPMVSRKVNTSSIPLVSRKVNTSSSALARRSPSTTLQQLTPLFEFGSNLVFCAFYASPMAFAFEGSEMKTHLLSPRSKLTKNCRVQISIAFGMTLE
jgi:hypothetical protein